MRPQGKKSNVINDAPTIDEVGGENCPSLVGFYKCSDATDTVIPDHSGNGYNLEMLCTKEGSAIGSGCTGTESIILQNGYLSVPAAWGALIDVTGTLLDTDTNHVIFSAEFWNDGTSNDTDIGTGCFGNHEPSDADAFSGFNFGSVGAVVEARVLFDSGGQVQSTVQESSLASGESSSICGGYKPSAVFVGAYVTENTDGTQTISGLTNGTGSGAGSEPAALIAQNNYFGIRSSHTTASTLPIKNMQIWSFSSEPAYMDATVEWLAKNPGKIPPWWIGR